MYRTALVNTCPLSVGWSQQIFPAALRVTSNHHICTLSTCNRTVMME